eukprot:g5074.t1
MSNKKPPNNGHVSLTAQQMAFMHQIIESEDVARKRFARSPPRRKRNPILGEPTPRSTSREKDIQELRNAQLEHTRKSLAVTPTIAGRRRAAERAAAAKAIATVKTSTQVPVSAGRFGLTAAEAKQSSRKASARGSATGTARGTARDAGGNGSGRSNGGRASARISSRSTARSAGPSASARIRTSARNGSGRSQGASSKTVDAARSEGEKKSSPKVKEMKARKAWLERQLLEVEEQLATLPPDME